MTHIYSFVGRKFNDQITRRKTSGGKRSPVGFQWKRRHRGESTRRLSSTCPHTRVSANRVAMNRCAAATLGLFASAGDAARRRVTTPPPPPMPWFAVPLLVFHPHHTAFVSADSPPPLLFSSSLALVLLDAASPQTHPRALRGPSVAGLPPFSGDDHPSSSSSRNRLVNALIAFSLCVGCTWRGSIIS